MLQFRPSNTFSQYAQNTLKGKLNDLVWNWNQILLKFTKAKVSVKNITLFQLFPFLQIFFHIHTLYKKHQHFLGIAYRLAIPAFLTAVEMAFTAVQMEFSRLVSSPVPCAFLPSSRTNLVRVRTLVSKAPLSDILLSGVGLGPCA